MDYGTYMPDGSYSGWKTYNSEKRYFAFSQNKKYAYMKVGLSFINGVPMYFDQDGLSHNGWLELNGKKYYLNPITGYMVSNETVKIDNDYYKFNENGELV